jgi:pyruvate dehydrogenase E1 component beta subunit
VADIVREGTDVTIVATQQMRHRAVEAADLLAMEGIEVTIIDPRTLIPFDDEAVRASLEQTARLLVVQETVQAGSWGASLIARMVQDHFELFDAPPTLISTPDTPAPYAAALEREWLPSVEDIRSGVRDLVKW